MKGKSPAYEDLLSSSNVARTAESKELMERVLTAATRLFAEKGFVGTTTQELADTVGLVKGSLYYHIGSKDELLFRIHHEVTEEGIRRWTLLLEEDVSGSASDLLERMITEHCQVIDRYRDWVAVFSEEMKFLPPQFLEVVVERRDVYRDMLQGVIERGVASGEFTVKDPRLATLIVLGMLNSVYRWYEPGGRLSPAAVARLATSLILQGAAV